ncbi:hypothetical protein BCR34DRAFT_594473 [Clohesyomyces aquaticus]|uniref:Uncharacterized protein n=1 Tax=Clohesyomyces aquaticus TaxID=1231657 RepID=A0A1Y1Y8F0_9PLEO|nr:hypothetical protein BCR34DRAFT_594473 [Clohesyomyces aquaticus]
MFRGYDSADYFPVSAVNVQGVFNRMSAELRNMREAMSTRVGWFCRQRRLGCRPASKFAVIGSTKAAARKKSKTGIRINALRRTQTTCRPLSWRQDAELGFQLPNDDVTSRRGRPDESRRPLPSCFRMRAASLPARCIRSTGGLFCWMRSFDAYARAGGAARGRAEDAGFRSSAVDKHLSH